MASTWDVTVSNSAFTATVIHNDDGSWSWQLNPPNGPSGNLPSGFQWTSAFSMGASSQYQFSGGRQVNASEYTGSVTYPSAAAITTNWTAQKKAAVHAA